MPSQAKKKTSVFQDLLEMLKNLKVSPEEEDRASSLRKYYETLSDDDLELLINAYPNNAYLKEEWKKRKQGEKKEKEDATAK